MQLSCLFSDYAVFQRDMEIPVWGWAEPGVMIHCRFAGKDIRVMTDSSGRFLVRFPALHSGENLVLEVRNLNSSESIVVRGIAMGEVYLAGGQSNMEFRVREAREFFEPLMANCTNPRVRMITIPRQAQLGTRVNAECAWERAAKETVPEFSAVSFVFACELEAKLGCPVGIIHSSWGGTVAEAWISRETLVRMPAMRDRVRHYEMDLSDDCDIPEDRACKLQQIPHSDDLDLRMLDLLASRIPLVDPETDFGRRVRQSDFDDSGWPSLVFPKSWMAEDKGHYGYIWLRKTVRIPDSWAGRPATLHLCGIDKQDVTYFNGREVGRTGRGYESCYWQVSRTYPIPAELVKAGPVAVAVRGFSYDQDGSFNGRAQDMYLECGTERIELAGSWKFQQEIDYGMERSSRKPGAGVPNSPYILFDNMIVPLIPYAFRGVIWYQGESNQTNFSEYADLMRNLITDWRYRFGNGDFSFYQVQLAGYESKSLYEDTPWAYIRDAQLEVCRTMPHTGMAMALDVGDETDIHPKDKITVGKRLARWALYHDFQMETVPSGPLFREFRYEADKLRIFFDFVGGGLTADGGKVEGFVISFDGVRFTAAEARIEGDTVVIPFDPAKSRPLAVRYAWSKYPSPATLRNREGLPASPFRTGARY